jgi:hypothetical protein
MTNALVGIGLAPSQSAASIELPELARQCLYYMALMREVEDRIERKL